MSFTKGPVTVTRLLALGPVPSVTSALEAMKEEPYRPFQDGSEEERACICDFTNHLKGSPDEERSYTWMNGMLHFGIRFDTRKIPAAELSAHIEIRIETLMREKDLAFISKEARISIQDEVKAELLPKQKSVIKVTEVVWDMKKGILYVGSQSPKVVSYLQEFLFRVFRLDIQVLGQVNLASHLLMMDRNALLQGMDRSVAEPLMGELFLGWLWRQSLEQGGKANDDDETCLLFGDSIKLVSEEGKAQEVSLKKGDPVESKAALEALASGMRPAQAKFTLKAGEMEWTFGLSAYGIQPSGLKLPPSTANTPQGRIADRVYLVQEALIALDTRFKAFLAVWREQGPDELHAGLMVWAGAARDQVDAVAEVELDESVLA